jgi:hypothetical protein
VYILVTGVPFAGVDFLYPGLERRMIMQQNWRKETPDQVEEVNVQQDGLYERRQEVHTDLAAARHEALTKSTQLIWLLFGILEGLIALRIILKLIGANPASPFANLVYSVTDLFLWPFFGLTATPSLGNMTFEIFAVIAMIVYALLAWVIVKVLWLLLYREPVHSVSTYERDNL